MQSEWQFYVLAAAFGTVQGGVQALSRSYFASLIPRERAGEYFGFYNMLAKFAAVLGPLVMGVVAITTGNQRLSIVALAFFFVVGAWLLSRVPEGARAARQRVIRAANRRTARSKRCRFRGCARGAIAQLRVLPGQWPQRGGKFRAFAGNAIAVGNRAFMRGARRGHAFERAFECAPRPGQ